MGHAFVKEWPDSGRGTNRAWVAYFCARCHSDSAFMNRFNPALPTDQLDKFKTSPHGKLLLETKDSRAPDCVSCHAVHGILPALLASLVLSVVGMVWKAATKRRRDDD